LNQSQINHTLARPLSIYIITLWSLIRGILSAVNLYGEFIFLEAAFGLGYGNGNFFNIWSLSPSRTRTFIILSIIQIIVFCVLAIGIFQGFNWARLGFIFTSIAVLIWKTLGILYNGLALGSFGPLHPFLHNLLAVCIALWYFDQSHVLEYFGVKRRFLDRTYQQVYGYPLIVVITLGLGVLVGLFELLGFGFIARFLYPDYY
jgi:hypothetical protein